MCFVIIDDSFTSVQADQTILLAKANHFCRDFLAYFIATIGSYSQLKIAPFFPIDRKKFPLKVTKLKK